MVEFALLVFGEIARSTVGLVQDFPFIPLALVAYLGYGVYDNLQNTTD